MILTVVRVRPSGSSADSADGDGLEVLCRRLSIISQRDMDGTVTVVFRSMLTRGRATPVGSSELAEMTQLNRVTIIHHLQRLEQMGLVEHTDRKYRLRVRDLSSAVEQMREAMMASFQEAESLAEQLDREFGMESVRPFGSDAPAVQAPARPPASAARSTRPARAPPASRSVGTPRSPAVGSAPSAPPRSVRSPRSASDPRPARSVVPASSKRRSRE